MKLFVLATIFIIAFLNLTSATAIATEACPVNPCAKPGESKVPLAMYNSEGQYYSSKALAETKIENCKISIEYDKSV